MKETTVNYRTAKCGEFVVKLQVEIFLVVIVSSIAHPSSWRWRQHVPL